MLHRSIVEAAAEAVGAEVQIIGPTRRGESGSTFAVRVGRDEAILKLVANGPGVVENQTRLVCLVGRLRGRGSPVPDYLGSGHTDAVAFTLQRRLPGVMLEPRPGQGVDPGVVDAVLPSLLDAVELQADIGDLSAPRWSGWLLDTIESGGDGYCLYTTMRARADTTSILERVIDIGREFGHGPVRTSDIVHLDLSPANVLHERGRLTGIVDWNVPFDGAAQGDRGFDVATVLFYTYDNRTTRDRLWTRASAISGERWTAVYLAHLVLRQVEWSVRHHPDSHADLRFRHIAMLVLNDCETVTS